MHDAELIGQIRSEGLRDQLVNACPDQEQPLNLVIKPLIFQKTHTTSKPDVFPLACVLEFGMWFAYLDLKVRTAIPTYPLLPLANSYIFIYIFNTLRMVLDKSNKKQ